VNCVGGGYDVDQSRYSPEDSDDRGFLKGEAAEILEKFLETSSLTLLLEET
jgi:hypothetical protein